MNCANHADASAVAYCRTCGKALCANCTRPVRGVIYCEDCLGAKMEGVPAGTTGFAPGAPSSPYSPFASGQTPAPLPPPVWATKTSPAAANTEKLTWGRYCTASFTMRASPLSEKSQPDSL